MTSSNYYNLIKIIIIVTLTINCTATGQDYNRKIKKAAILSTACPGLGQIYNKKYWKTPVIYTALGSTAYYYIDNNNKYLDYKKAYITRNDEDPLTIDNYPNYTNNNLITLQDYYRNSRDLSGLLFIFIYILNIVDASVDAHLTEYNIDDDLSLQFIPVKNKFETLNISLKYNL